MHKINMNVVKRHIFPINKPSIPPEEKSRENQRFSKKKTLNLPMISQQGCQLVKQNYYLQNKHMKN